MVVTGRSAEDVRALKLLSCTLSIIGSAFIVAVYLLFCDSRTLGRKMLAILSAIDLCQGVMYALPEGDARVCQVQGRLLYFNGPLLVSWTTCVAIYAYLAITGHPQINRIFWQLVAGSLAFACAIGGLCSTEEPAWANLWCWLPANEKHARVMRACFYVLVWLSLVVNLALYIAIHRRIAQLLASGKVAASLRVQSLRSVTYIPLILIVIRLPGSLHRALQLAGSNEGGRELTLLQAFGDPSQGFLDAVMFGFLNKPLRQRVWASLRTCRIAPGDADVAASLIGTGSELAGLGDGAGEGADALRSESIGLDAPLRASESGGDDWESERASGRPSPS